MSDHVRIYDRQAFEDALGEDVDDGFRGPEDERPRAANIERTSEGEMWARCMRKILASPYGDTRPVLMGTPEMAARLVAETAAMPHFAVITGIIERAIRLSSETGRPLLIPTILALAPPGAGKTFYTKTVARVINTTCIPIAMNGTSDRRQLGGLSSAWRGAKMGKLARGLLLDCPAASPLYLLDELDKSTKFSGENVVDVLLSAVEPENARAERPNRETTSQTPLLKCNEKRPKPPPLKSRRAWQVRQYATAKICYTKIPATGSHNDLEHSQSGRRSSSAPPCRDRQHQRHQSGRHNS